MTTPQTLPSYRRNFVARPGNEDGIDKAFTRSGWQFIAGLPLTVVTAPLSLTWVLFALNGDITDAMIVAGLVLLALLVFTSTLVAVSVKHRRELEAARDDIRPASSIRAIVDVELPWGDAAVWQAAEPAALHAVKTARRDHLVSLHALTPEQAVELNELECDIEALAHQVVSLVAPGAQPVRTVNAA